MEQHNIPPQETGNQTDVLEEKTLPTEEAAKAFYGLVKQRLLNINRWQDISPGVSSSFGLKDRFGNAKDGGPQPGDFIQIDIPGPGPEAGEGYDWVRVEAVEDYSQPGALQESIALRVRPSHDPRLDEGVAHFFDSKATSSFVVKREKNVVSAGIHGRNEDTNTASKTISDKLRNATIKIAAVVGFSAIQWRKLAKGFLEG